VQKQADSLAHNVLRDDAADRRRLDHAYISVLSRPATSAEADLALSYLGKMRQRAGESYDANKAWRSLCRVLMASNEFVFVF
jgi:hypothetical protein